MERWAKDRSPNRHRSRSFSATLLAAIDRSIDESDGGGDPDSSTAPAYRSTAKLKRDPASLPGRSDCGGRSFSSSSYDLDLMAIRPIRTTASLPPTPRGTSTAASHRQEAKKLISTQSKVPNSGRRKEPSSPGARLAGFLNFLFADSAAGKPRKPKSKSVSGDGEASTCSCASSSFSRRCQAKTSSTGGQPASVGITLDVRRRGCEGDKASWVTSAEEAKGKGKVREAVRKKVEELLRREAKEEEATSDSSSDLFELEDLTVPRGRGHDKERTR
ncbi:protein BIG GRAIN 1-like [Zingiber officinale]|uniref:protein BIG GRAIN 1-like n=1 Tax=Zingiber officinale TaxID=94328 RepID=UPI001C4C9F82|nr:protein BIG GRAIN 1-like [Zingiber officinale]